LRRTFINLVIFDFILWVLGTVGGYFFLAWLLRPARKQAHSQEEFLANASHELKTPITTIKTELALLQVKAAPEKIQESLTVITNENHNLQNLVDKLLLATTQAKNHCLPFDLITLTKSRLVAHEKNFIHKKLDFKLQAPKTLMINSDPYKLRQILDLLLDNAGKYAEEKTMVKIKVSCEGKQALIKVINRGLGIAWEDQEKIWQRFYRVTSKKVQLQAGSGLGLAIARELTQELGGNLILVSGQPAATCFQLILPVK
jgi:signal transduction histidine kinase